MVKPARGLSGSWYSRLPRDRRMALLSLGMLLALLAVLVAYQTYFLPTPNPMPQPAPVEPTTPSPTPESVDPSEVPPTKAESDAPAASAGPQQPVKPTTLAYPLSGEPRVVKAFGAMDHAYGDLRLYTATAYEVQPGQAVLAAARGTVTTVDTDPAEGMLLVIDHGGGMSTRYTGLAKVRVSQGTTVEAGAVLGETGAPTQARAEMGPHLAFAVWVDGEPVDPATYLKE